MVHPPRSVAVGVGSTILVGIFSTEIVRTAVQGRADRPMSSFPPVPGNEIDPRLIDLGLLFMKRLAYRDDKEGFFMI